MTTSTPVLLEFRCNRCWNSNLQMWKIRYRMQLSPLRTNTNHSEAHRGENRSCHGALGTKVQKLSPAGCRASYDERIPTDAELREIARRELSSHSPMDFSGYPRASTVQRFLAYVIDVTMTVFVVIGGFFFTSWISTLGSGPTLMDEINLHGEMSLSSLITFATLPALFTITQYFLLATTGQTLGKKIMCIGS